MTIDEQNSLLTTSLTANALSVVATGVDVSLDETTGLQNFTATPAPAGDADDNDTATALPSAFSTRLTALGAGTAMDAALSGYNGANAGSDAFTISGATSATDVSFVGSNGAPLNGFDSGLDTLDGTSILLYTDTVNNNIVLGRAGGSAGAIVFAAYIEETGSPITGGKIWTVEYQPLKHLTNPNPDDSLDLTDKVFIGASQNLEFSLKDAPSGQNLFLMFTTANPATETVNGVVRITDPAIIATGKDPANQSTGVNINTGDTINTSQAGGPTTFGTNNQMITEQEGIRFSFVTGAKQDVTIPNLDQNEADVEANIDYTGVVNVKTVSFDVVQLQSGKSAVVKISAFSTAVESGTQFIDGYAGDAKVDIVSVRVLNSAGTVLENSAGQENDPAIGITFVNGIATITGIKAGYAIEYTTTADHNRVLIENGAALTAKGNEHADFDIDGLHLFQASITKAEIGSKMIFDDDGPAAAGTAVAGTVDEDGLTNGIAGGTDDVAGEATTAGGSVTGIFQSGVDTPLSYALSSDTSGLPALSSGGVALVYSVVGNTLTAKAGVAGADVFTFSLTAAGVYSFTLLKPLDHPAGNNENDITLNLGSLLRATDKDGDTVTAAAEKLVITVDDDTPTATGTAVTGTVDEDGLANGIAGGTDDVAGEATTAGGSVTGIFQSGADTPLSYALSSDTSGLPALSSGGVALVYSVVGNTLTAKAGVAGADVFTFSLTAAGVYSFTLLKPLDHAAGNNENNITLNLGTLLQATDKDGDTVTAAAEKLAIIVDDDTPTATGTAVTGTVDEDGLANGIAGGTDDVAGEATTAGGSVTGIFQSGADTPLSYALSSDTSGLPALSSGGVALVYSVVGNTLTAKAGVAGADVFTLSLTAAGVYSFALLKQLDHATANNENDITINLGTLLQATDADGDTVTAAAEKLVITVDDDTPVVRSITNLAGFDTPLTGRYDFGIGADQTGNSAVDGVVLNASGLTGTTSGGRAITDAVVTHLSEDATSVTYAFAFNYFTTSAPSTAQLPASGTVTFNKADGTFVFDLAGPIMGGTTFSTSDIAGLKTYDTEGANSPEITVREYNADFVGVLYASASDGGKDVILDMKAGGDYVFTAGDTFASQVPAFINVSTSTLGANSDTLQPYEVLNFDFFVDNPVAPASPSGTPQNPTSTPGAAINFATGKAVVDTIAITLNQININGEDDVAIVLKLRKISDGTLTTTLLIANAATDYVAVAGTQNHVVTVGTDDYDSANYKIYGVQVLASTETVSGTGIRLSDHSVVTLTAGNGTYADTSDNDVLKIVKIDAIINRPADADLQFTGNVVDADGDATPNYSFSVHLEGDSQVLTGSAGSDYLTGTGAADTMNGGAGADFMSGGAGADLMTGGTGADQFVFAAGDSGITLATADTVTDFLTGVDTIATSQLPGNATIADGGALVDFAAFVTAANAVLTAGAGTNDVYVAYNAAASDNAWVVVDENDSGSVDAGDTVIVLVGVNLVTEVATGDFV